MAEPHVGSDAVEVEDVAALGREQRLPMPLLVALQADGAHVLTGRGGQVGAKGKDAGKMEG